MRSRLQAVLISETLLEARVCADRLIDTRCQGLATVSLLTFNVCWHNCKEALFKRGKAAEKECIFKLHLCLTAAPC